MTYEFGTGENPSMKSAMLGLPWLEIPDSGVSPADMPNGSVLDLRRPVQLDQGNAPTASQLDEFLRENPEAVGRLVYVAGTDEETAFRGGRGSVDPEQDGFLFVTGLKDLPRSGEFTTLEAALDEMGAKPFMAANGAVIPVWPGSRESFPNGVFATQTITSDTTPEAYGHLAKYFNTDYAEQDPVPDVPDYTIADLGDVAIGRFIWGRR